MSTSGVVRTLKVADPNQGLRDPDAAAQHLHGAKDVLPPNGCWAQKSPVLSKKPHRFPSLAPAFCLGFAAFWL